MLGLSRMARSAEIALAATATIASTAQGEQPPAPVAVPNELPSR